MNTFKLDSKVLLESVKASLPMLPLGINADGTIGIMGTADTPSNRDAVTAAVTASLVVARSDVAKKLRNHLYAYTKFNSVWYDTDETARISLAEAVFAVQNNAFPPEGIKWRAADNNWYLLSGQDILDLYAAAILRKQQVFAAFHICVASYEQGLDDSSALTSVESKDPFELII